MQTSFAYTVLIASRNRLSLRVAIVRNKEMLLSFYIRGARSNTYLKRPNVNFIDIDYYTAKLITSAPR